MTFRTISKEEFLEHCQLATSKSFLQSPEMATLLEKRGFTVSFLGLWNPQQELVISALIYTKKMFGGIYMELNAGPVSTDDNYLPDFYKHLKEYATTNGVLELVVKPAQDYQQFDSDGQPTSPENQEEITYLTNLGYQHDGLKTGYPGGEPDWHYVKDLTGIQSENLIASFSKKGRPIMKKVHSFNMKIRPLKRDELHIFKEITSSTSERREYTDKGLAYYQDFYDSFGSSAEFMVATLNFQEYLQLLIQEQATIQAEMEEIFAVHGPQPDSVKPKTKLKNLNKQLDALQQRIEETNGFLQKYGPKDVVLAGSLFIYTPQEAVYLFSGSYTEFNKFYAPFLLQEHVMLEAIKRQITFYNFLGITGEFDGSDGVLRFKQNFNGYVVRKMGTFRYYPQPLKYKTIQILKKLLRRS
ncbi:aminoacyltransferase [Streptococcus suis]|uniref:Aminoacyltransferase FemA n=1 Tax=Streptococcus suis TaxID=1307 RepID=A0A4T2GP57_STRSU|nr:aminoacyltransferase [Streptococcus suis]MBM7268716.1 aminoacyltransferase [Streptococcus suis]MBM7269570.1 aminoacyltransferase [Streptococcus suis]TII00331.1 aminoacyltransferase [Streptococcus suis]TII00773.1 aminoacyltransferase [Streptococcus suis]